MIWKRLNTETDPKVSLVRFLLFSRIIWNPSKTKKCWGISEYFGSVSAIYIHLICFPFFCSVSSFFWVSFQFSEKFLNFQFVDLFPLYLGPFPLILGPFPIFNKSFKFSVCWSVSFFFRGRFLFFFSPFPVFKKSFKFSACWSVSSFLGSVSSFLGPFPVFKKVLNSQFLDRLTHFLGSVSSFFGSVSGFQKKFLILSYFWEPETDPKNECVSIASFPIWLVTYK